MALRVDLTSTASFPAASEYNAPAAVASAVLSTPSRAHGKKRREFGLELEQAAEKSHKREGTDNFDGYQHQADSTEFENVAQKKARPQQHDSGFEPEFVSGDTCAENFRDADSVGDHQAQNDGPKNVFDVRKRPVMRFGVGADVLLQ